MSKTGVLLKSELLLTLHVNANLANIEMAKIFTIIHYWRTFLLLLLLLIPKGTSISANPMPEQEIHDTTKEDSHATHPITAKNAPPDEQNLTIDEQPKDNNEQSDLSELSDKVQIIGLPITLLSILIATWRYFDLRSREIASEQFRNYHDNIKSLVGATSDDTEPKLNHQIICAFEVRRYPAYRDASIRTLEDLKRQLSEHSDPKRTLSALITEINITLDFLKRPKLCRILSRLSAWCRYKTP